MLEMPLAVERIRQDGKPEEHVGDRVIEYLVMERPSVVTIFSKPQCPLKAPLKSTTSMIGEKPTFHSSSSKS